MGMEPSASAGDASVTKAAKRERERGGEGAGDEVACCDRDSWSCSFVDARVSTAVDRLCGLTSARIDLQTALVSFARHGCRPPTPTAATTHIGLDISIEIQ